MSSRQVANLTSASRVGDSTMSVLGKRAELAGARQIVAHDFADVGVRRQAAALETERHDRDRDRRRVAVDDVDAELLRSRIARCNAEKGRDDQERSSQTSCRARADRAIGLCMVIIVIRRT